MGDVIPWDLQMIPHEEKEGSDPDGDLQILQMFISNRFKIIYQVLHKDGCGR